MEVHRSSTIKTMSWKPLHANLTFWAVLAAFAAASGQEVPDINYDGLHAWPYPDDDRAAAAKRLQRLGRRPQFICQEVVSNTKDALDVTRTYLKQAYPDGNLTFELIPFRNRDHVRVGYALAALADMKFKKRPDPILAVPGGGEMPRVFREGGAWHMFYHHFGGGSTWQHHVSDDGIHWRLYDANFFGGHPTGGPRDIMMIYGMSGTLLEEPKMLVAGSQDGINKLWLYHLRKKGAAGK